jgi:hypothetical protein
MQTHSRIRWGRILVAALMSEVAVVAVLGIIIAAWRFLIAPGGSDTDYQALGNLVGYYVALPAAGVAVFFGALWATRRLTAGVVANGTLVGVSAVILTSGFLVAAGREDRLMYVVSFVRRIIGGWLGGWVAHRASARHPATAMPA